MTQSLSAVRPVEGRATARALAELTVQLHDLRSTAETVDAIVQFAVQAINCTYAAIVLQGEAGCVALGGAGHEVPGDLCQRAENDGPLVEAVRDGVIYAPLSFGNGVVGALVLYRPLDDGFSDADIAIARALACHASVALTAVRRHEQLSKATERRSLIGQAAGILMERHTLDADEAFAVLHSHAAKRGLEVHTLAAELVATRVRLGTGTPESAARPGPRPQGEVVMR